MVLIAALATAQEAPKGYLKSVEGLTFVGVEGADVSLEDLAGNYLYIDFWFEGCAPCIEQFPHSAKLEEKLNELPIKFIAVSYEKTYDDWLAALERQKPNGLNLWVGSKEIQKTLASEYGNTFFPRYWLVNDEGVIVNPSTGRPTNYLENTYGMYDKLLKDLKSLQGQQSDD